MKLRIRCNSIRIGMDRKDLAELLHRGRVLESVHFGLGSDRAFMYEVAIGVAPPGRPHAVYAAGLLVVIIGQDDAQAWSRGNLVGFDHQQAVDGGTVRVVLEKDFTCMDRSTEGATEDAWAFPNPSAACQ